MAYIGPRMTLDLVEYLEGDFLDTLVKGPGYMVLGVTLPGTRR